MSEQVFSGDYPANWKELATSIKDEAGWECIRCGHEHDPAAGYCLTIHHLDGDKSNNRWHNLAPLCQRCHLHIQSKVVMARTWMFEHSAWFRPFVAGYYAFHAGEPDDRASVMERVDELIAIGQGQMVEEAGVRL